MLTFRRRLKFIIVGVLSAASALLASNISAAYDGECAECWWVIRPGQPGQYQCRHSFNYDCSDGPGWCIDSSPGCYS